MFAVVVWFPEFVSTFWMFLFFIKSLWLSIDSLVVWTGKWLAFFGFLILHLVSDRTTGGTNHDYPDILQRKPVWLVKGQAHPSSIQLILQEVL